MRDTLWQTLFLAPEADVGDLLETLWTRLRAAGLPIERSTVALRTLNAKIAADTRVDACLATIGDGVMIVRKR